MLSFISCLDPWPHEGYMPQYRGMSGSGSREGGGDRRFLEKKLGKGITFDNNKTTSIQFSLIDKICDALDCEISDILKHNKSDTSQ